MAAPTCNLQQKPPWKHYSKGPFPTPQRPALSTPSSSPASHCQAGTRPGGQRALPPPHSWKRGALLRSLKSLFSGSGRKQEEVGRAWRLPEHRGEARTADASATHGAMGSLPAHRPPGALVPLATQAGRAQPCTPRLREGTAALHRGTSMEIAGGCTSCVAASGRCMHRGAGLGRVEVNTEPAQKSLK